MVRYGMQTRRQHQVTHLLTTAHCGRSGLPDNTLSGNVDLAYTLCPHPQTSYIVHVTGDSMSACGLLSGDYVIVDPGVDVSNGDVALICLNGELMCKRISIVDGVTFLCSDSKGYIPIEVTEDDSIVILGAVISRFGLLKTRLHAA